MLQSTDSFPCDNKYASFSLLQLAAVISNEEILSALFAHCDKELVTNKHKNNELKAIDFAYLSGNRHIMNKISEGAIN
ncbi:MAG: hypothetical protein MRQ09_06755 [Candidatus Midichloria sp.]|nr:hypothetical protein [Candidatus Midichloria sp.]